MNAHRLVLAIAGAALGYIKGLQRGGTIHTADGDEVPLPPFALNQFVPFGTPAAECCAGRSSS